MQEVIEKRTPNSKTHSLGNNKFTWDGTIGKIHRWDGTSYQNIDNSFVPAVAPWDWEMSGADYTIRVLENFTAGQILQFEKQGENVQFQPMALEWTNDLDQIQQVSMPQVVSPIITNPEVDLLPAVGVLCPQGTIKWEGAYGNGIDFQWRCTPTRLEKRLVIDNFSTLPTPQQYILDGGNPVLRLNLIFGPSNVDIVVDGEIWNKKTKVQTFNRIGFWKDGEEFWGFLPLRYWDSSGGVGQSVATLEKRGNKLYILIRVSYDWLQTATYPVFIDTDIDPQPAQVGASNDDASERDSDGNILLTWANIVLGAFQGYYYSGMRFSSVTIPSGATIDVAYLTWRSSSSESGSFENDLYGEDGASPGVFTSATNDITNRTRTTAVVQCDSGDLGTWNTVTDYDSPSIVSIITELVGDYDYSSGAPMVILSIWQSGSGRRLAFSYDGDTALATKLHIEYTAAGGVDYPISITAGLTASSTVAYAAAWDRGMSPGLTVSATIVQVFGRLITTAANLTASVTVAKIVAYVRSSSPGLTVSASIDRIVAYAKAVQAGLTSSITIVRKFGKTISSTADLTVSATIARVWNRTIITSPGLVISATIDRVLGWQRALSPGLTTAVTVLKGWGRTLSTVAGLTISATVARQVAWNRATTANLTIAVNVIKGWGRAIATSADLTVSATVAKLLAYGRATIANQTISTTVSRFMAYKKATSTGLTAVVSIIVIFPINYLITIVANLTVSTTIVRFWSKTVVTTANLTISVIVRYCTVLKELLRIPISKMAALRTPLSRLNIKRIVPSRLAWWRRKKECSDD